MKIYLAVHLGNREEGKWVDVDFWGNELTLHKKPLTKLNYKAVSLYGFSCYPSLWSAFRKKYI